MTRSRSTASQSGAASSTMMPPSKWSRGWATRWRQTSCARRRASAWISSAPCYLRLADQRILLADGKAVAYAGAIDTLLSEGRPLAEGSLNVPKEALNSLVHKLLHASASIPLGRQHLYHVRRALKAENRLGGARAVLGRAAIAELRWQRAQLLAEEPIGVPFATRRLFPAPGGAGVLTPYSDASKEEENPTESGYGAWCVIDGTFAYVEGRWTEAEGARTCSET